MLVEKSIESFDVVIVGGGVSGLSAAVYLSNKNYKVALVEQNKILGGRTNSFINNKFGDEVDNGQHVMMGCYFDTLNYLRLIGAIDGCYIQQKLSIVFRLKNNKEFKLQASNLPSPFHILTGILRLKEFTFSEKISLIKVGLVIKNINTDDNYLQNLTVEDWLNSLNQTEKLKRYIWNIISIATLNGSTKNVSALLFIKILKEIFFGKKSNSAMIIPRNGLSKLFVEKGISFIEENGGRVFNQTEITNYKIKRNEISEVSLSNKVKLSTKGLILAIPYYAIKNNPINIFYPKIDFNKHFISSAIITIHLWFEGKWLNEKFVALVDSPLHWIFNHSAIKEDYSQSRQYISIVISGANLLISKSKSEIFNMTIKELEKFYPTSKNHKLLDWKVIKEKRATFSPTIGLDKWRPSAITKMENVFLAGDWTDTQLPATIEGGIKSGFIAAKLFEEKVTTY